MNEHPFKPILLDGEDNPVVIDIDIELVRIIKLLNNHMKLFTGFCCQGGEIKPGYLLFWYKTHFKKFLKYVPAQQDWEIYHTDVIVGNNNTTFVDVVRFPVADIPYIEMCLEQAHKLI